MTTTTNKIYICYLQEHIYVYTMATLKSYLQTTWMIKRYRLVKLLPNILAKSGNVFKLGVLLLGPHPTYLAILNKCPLHWYFQVPIQPMSWWKGWVNGYKSHPEQLTTPHPLLGMSIDNMDKPILDIMCENFPAIGVNRIKWRFQGEECNVITGIIIYLANVNEIASWECRGGIRLTWSPCESTSDTVSTFSEEGGKWALRTGEVNPVYSLGSETKIWSGLMGS